MEDGQIPGLRVAEFPNSTKVLSSVPASTLAPDSTGVSGSGFRVPPLASYSDAFFPLLPDVVACRICRDKCDSDYYSSEKVCYGVKLIDVSVLSRLLDVES